METSTAFNNAGVEFFERGYPAIAWDLFKGALEVKLASEKHAGKCSFYTASTTCERYHRLLHENIYVYQAHQHFQRYERYGIPPCAEDESSCKRTGEEKEEVPKQSRSPSKPRPTMTSCDDGSYSPYVFSRPLQIAQPAVGGDEARMSSTTIIFNLAVVEHLYGSHVSSLNGDNSSSSAIALYRLASSLIAGRHACSTIGLALMNNLSCLYFEAKQVHAAQACIDIMARVLHRRRSGSSSTAKVASLSDAEMGALMSNVIWIMNPPITASPAA